MKPRAVRRVCVLGMWVGVLSLLTGCGGGGGATVVTPPATDNPVPAVSSLSPASATAGAAAQTLTINGTNFLSSSTVTYNGVAHTASFVSATALTISLSAGDQATAGSYPVVVTNPAPGGGASNSVNFAVNASNPVPTITSLSPASATAGAAAQTLTINGTNFLNSSTVTYNGVAHAASFVSATTLTISLSAGDQATAGNYPVVVTNPAPGGGASNSVNFTVSAAASISISPTSLPNGTVGVAYSQALSASGGTAPYTWSITAGALPTGMNLSSGGTISGTPIAVGAPSFTVQARDSSSSHLTGTHVLTVDVIASATHPNGITVSGSNVTGIDLSLSTLTPSLGVADVGTCVSSGSGTACSASVTGIQISKSGAATASCPSATCTVWLLGEGLSNTSGTTLPSGISVSVTQGATTDATVSNVSAGPVANGLTGLSFHLAVTGTAATGARDIVVKLANGETQIYTGAVEIVN